LTNDPGDLVRRLELQDPEEFLPSNSVDSVVKGFAAQRAILARKFMSSNFAVSEFPILAAPYIFPLLLKPLSRGRVHIDPSDPQGNPLVEYRTLSNPIDVEIFIHQMKLGRRYLSTPTLIPLGITETVPGTGVQSDAELEVALRAGAIPSIAHPVGTASMMPESLGGVVGPDLLVHGVTNLSVADASIIPLIPGTHTVATVYAIAEKVSQLVYSLKRQRHR
jgi:choline dehydrogenase